MLAEISKRRAHQRDLQTSGVMDQMADKLPYILPEYMVVYAVPILAHDPEFTGIDNTQQLLHIRQCLSFVLEALMYEQENCCFVLLKSLIQEMKNHRDASNPDDEECNVKFWTVCDMAMDILLQEQPNFKIKDYPSRPRLPLRFFK